MNRRWRLGIPLLLIVVLLGGCLTSTKPAAQTDHRQSTTVQISAREMLMTVSELVSPTYQGRKAGTIGERLASSYITERMRALDLKPMGVRDQFQQSFETIVTTVKAPTNLRLLDLPGGATKELRYGYDFRPNIYSQSGNMTGPVAFAGYGVVSTEAKIDNYQGVDLKGKAVLILDGVPEAMKSAPISVEAKAQWAKNQGAAAVLIGPDPRKGSEHAAWARALRRGSGSKVGPSIIPTFLISPQVVTDLLVGQDLNALMDQIGNGGKPVILPRRVAASVAIDRLEKGVANNVLGMITGSDPNLRDKVLVIGAHFDALGMNPDDGMNAGAHDNASGTAVVLELARVLAKEPPPFSTLIAAWGAEENGLIGSQYFVNNPTVPLEQIIGCVNFDMVGWKQGDLELHRTTKGDNKLAASAQRQAEALHIPLQLRDYMTGSDGYHFEQKGIATIWFADSWNSETLPEYHTPDDKPELIGEQRIGDIAKLANAVIWDLASELTKK
ncbi:MAG: M28 family peptidase [Bacillota bacterium]